LNRIEDRDSYPQPTELSMQLTHKDIWLDNFMFCQPAIEQLQSGDKLILSGTSCLNTRGQLVVKFSSSYIEQLEDLAQKGYKPVTASVKYIVYWQKENADKEIRIVLPELVFSR
ncbi:MAG: hypothetical protein GX815_03255, partial [Clostridiales bacterium]|nr:hypothetical protein [Clostridiales bacterium]